MKEYNGHRSWNAWNVSLWIGNDEGLYRLAMNWLNKTNRNKRGNAAAVRRFIDDIGGPLTKTPDGATYNPLSVKLALEGLID